MIMHVSIVGVIHGKFMISLRKCIDVKQTNVYTIKRNGLKYFHIFMKKLINKKLMTMTVVFIFVACSIL